MNALKLILAIAAALAVFAVSVPAKDYAAGERDHTTREALDTGTF